MQRIIFIIFFISACAILSSEAALDVLPEQKKQAAALEETPKTTAGQERARRLQALKQEISTIKNEIARANNLMSQLSLDQSKFGSLMQQFKEVIENTPTRGKIKIGIAELAGHYTPNKVVRSAVNTLRALRQDTTPQAQESKKKLMATLKQEAKDYLRATRDAEGREISTEDINLVAEDYRRYNGQLSIADFPRLSQPELETLEQWAKNYAYASYLTDYLNHFMNLQQNLLKKNG